MRVLFSGPSVRGPAGVADAVGAVQRVQPDGLFQVAKLTLGAAHIEPAIVGIDRQPGRIVAAILQPLQPFENDGRRPAISDVADDSAHKFIIGG